MICAVLLSLAAAVSYHAGLSGDQVRASSTVGISADGRVSSKDAEPDVSTESTGPKLARTPEEEESFQALKKYLEEQEAEKEKEEAEEVKREPLRRANASSDDSEEGKPLKYNYDIPGIVLLEPDLFVVRKIDPTLNIELGEQIRGLERKKPKSQRSIYSLDDVVIRRLMPGLTTSLTYEVTGEMLSAYGKDKEIKFFDFDDVQNLANVFANPKTGQLYLYVKKIHKKPKFFFRFFNKLMYYQYKEKTLKVRLDDLFYNTLAPLKEKYPSLLRGIANYEEKTVLARAKAPGGKATFLNDLVAFDDGGHFKKLAGLLADEDLLEDDDLDVEMKAGEVVFQNHLKDRQDELKREEERREYRTLY